MSIKGLTAEQIANELPEEFPLWFVLVKGEEQTHILTPDKDSDGVLYLFTNQKDAEQYAYIVKKLAPAYKDRELIVASDLKEEIITNAIHYNQYIGVIPRNSAIKFFEAYEEFLGRYYGFD